jgi:uncharacterized membrane protein required for colicin V production
MNWLDIVLLIILAASVLTSFRKGFSRELIGLISVVLALLLGSWFYGPVGVLLAPYLSSRAAANFTGFLLVFMGVILVGALVSWIVGKFLRVTGLSIFDHILGAGFGAVRGTLISVALIMGIMAFSPGSQPPASVVDSRMAPYVVQGARVFAAIAPRELKDGFRKTYDQVRAAWESALERGLHAEPRKEKGEHEKRI